jgi:NADH-quinone oxidoreductase subunit H
MLLTIYFTLTTLVPLLITIAFFTLAERKVIAAIQRRQGPTIVGFWGLLQALADGLKLVLKEVIIPYQANRFIFLLAPCLTFIISFLNWSLIPFNYNEVILDFNYSLLYLYMFSSLGVYGIILAGWTSRSRYPFLGAVRSAAQMISYEVSIGSVILIFALLTNSINLVEIIYFQENISFFFFLLLPINLIFFISIIAETNRAPFDLPEAEAEIVAGYNLEYSSFTFALFFLGEYSNIILMSALYVLLFWGGWLPIFFFSAPAFWFSLKILVCCFVFILVRTTFPRYRYDQLMDVGWKIFFPFNLVFFLIIFFIIYTYIY